MKLITGFFKLRMVSLILGTLVGVNLALMVLVQAQATQAHSTASMTVGPAETDTLLVVGGLDISRANVTSFPEGPGFEEARASLVTSYPQVTYTAMLTLTQPALAAVDILILSPTYDGFNPMTPLAAAEQAALLDFVAGGGCAILLPDNQDFAPANESLIDPFGMDITGMIWGWSTMTVLNPWATPLTGGFHGEVTSFTQGWPGGLTDLGPYAESYAANGLGQALAVIEPGVIAPGSGAVMVYSDATTFLDSADGGGFMDNEILFLNSLAFCQRQDIYLPMTLRGVSN